MSNTVALTETEIQMLAFPVGVTYSNGRVTASSPELLKRAFGLLKLGYFACRMSKGSVIVYGSTKSTGAIGGYWLGSAAASLLRSTPVVVRL